MEAFLRAARLLMEPDAAARAEADAWLQRWQRSAAAWLEAQQLVQMPGTPVYGKLLAAQTLRGKVLLDLDQVSSPEVACLRGALLELCDQAVTQPRAVRTQCALALADFALQTDWTDAIEFFMARWGGSNGHALVLLAVLSAVVEERNHKFIEIPHGKGLGREEDALIRRGVAHVGAYLEQLMPGKVAEFEVERAALHCSRIWIRWLPPPSAEWVEATASRLGCVEVGDEAADALIEAAQEGQDAPSSHGHLPAIICAAVAPRIGAAMAGGGEGRKLALRVAVEAGDAVIETLLELIETHGDSDAFGFLRVLATFAADDLSGTSRFFSHLAAALSPLQKTPSRMCADSRTAIAAAFEQALASGVAVLNIAEDEDALDLCQAAARGLGAEAALAHLLGMPACRGRTWALSVILPEEPFPPGAAAEQVWMELERAVAHPQPCAIALLQRASLWCASKETAFPVVVAALIAAGSDAATFGVIFSAAGPNVSPAQNCLAMLLKAAPGRPLLGRAALLVARSLPAPDFRSVLSTVFDGVVHTSAGSAAAALCGLEPIVADLRSLQRDRALWPVACEMLGGIAALAWTSLLASQPDPGCAAKQVEAALTVLHVALKAGDAAMPEGGLPAASKQLSEVFATSTLDVSVVAAADAFVLLLREFGKDAEAQDALSAGARVLVSVGMSRGWDPQSAQLRLDGTDHLAAALHMLGRAGRLAPRLAKGLFSDEVHIVSCAALTTLHPTLCLPALGVLEAWLEHGHVSNPAADRTWAACIAAVRAVPSRKVLEEVACFVEGLRETTGVPNNLLGLLQGAFGACAAPSRLDAAARALADGQERDISSTLEALAHCSLRLAVRGA